MSIEDSEPKSGCQFATIDHLAAEMLTVLVNEMKRLVYFLSCGLSFVFCACFKLSLLIWHH